MPIIPACCFTNRSAVRRSPAATSRRIAALMAAVLILVTFPLPQALAGPTPPAEEHITIVGETGPTEPGQTGPETASNASTLPSADTQEPLEASLRYLAVRDPDDPAITMAHQWLREGPPMRVPEGPQPRQFRANARYFTALLSGIEVAVVLEPSSPPTLYVDTDKDGDLSDEVRVAGRAVSTPRGKDAAPNYRFGPITVASEQDAQFFVETYGAKRLRLYPARYRMGVLKLNGRSHRVALVDCDCNGCYDGRFAPPEQNAAPSTWDAIALDHNGNGRFDPPAWDAQEVQPLTKMIQIGEEYYRVDVVPDGSLVRLEPATPRLGTLDVGGPNVELVLVGENGVFHLKGCDGQWCIPEGKYTCSSVILHPTEPDLAKQWALFSAGSEGQLEDFEIRAGETLSVPVGSQLMLLPFGGSTGVAAGSGLRPLGRVMLVDQAGVEYVTGTDLYSRIILPRSLSVADSSGERLQTVFRTARLVRPHKTSYG